MLSLRFVTHLSTGTLLAPDQTTYLRGLEQSGAGWTAAYTERDLAVARHPKAETKVLLTCPAVLSDDINDNSDDTSDT